VDCLIAACQVLLPHLRSNTYRLSVTSAFTCSIFGGLSPLYSHPAYPAGDPRAVEILKRTALPRKDPASQVIAVAEQLGLPITRFRARCTRAHTRPTSRRPGCALCPRPIRRLGRARTRNRSRRTTDPAARSLHRAGTSGEHRSPLIVRPLREAESQPGVRLPQRLLDLCSSTVSKPALLDPVLCDRTTRRASPSGTGMSENRPFWTLSQTRALFGSR
jgi:hypothetical protein